MFFLRSSMLVSILAMVLAAAAPVSADQVVPGSIGWAWWSKATTDQKQVVVMGEIDGIPAGYYEPLITLSVAVALTGNSSVKTVTNNLYKSVPKFSKTPAQYVTEIDGVYAKDIARKLSLGVVLECLADVPYGASTSDGCLNSFEH